LESHHRVQQFPIDRSWRHPPHYWHNKNLKPLSQKWATITQKAVIAGPAPENTTMSSRMTEPSGNGDTGMTSLADATIGLNLGKEGPDAAQGHRVRETGDQGQETGRGEPGTATSIVIAEGAGVERETAADGIKNTTTADPRDRSQDATDMKRNPNPIPDEVSSNAPGHCLRRVNPLRSARVRNPKNR
jgi:hypothetical protein